MIFEIKWKFATSLINSNITTNIETVYKTYENIIQKVQEQNDHATIWIYLRDEDSGNILSIYEGKIPDSNETDFVRWLADYAKKDKRTETINWVTNAISKYDNTNPTINSLIYSLWEKARKETDQTE